MSELAWTKAATRLKLDQAAGWPASLNLQRLSVLQADCGTKEQRGEARAIHDTLLAACRAGTLSGEAEERTIGPRYTVNNQNSTFARRNIYGERIYTPAPAPPPPRTTTVYRLSPATFATWLAGEGLTPSPLVAAWFKAAGTTKSTPPAELAQPAARAIPEPALAATATQKRGRNDAIKPLISKAQQEAANPEDASEVFNILKEWALRPKPPAPLMSGLSKDGKGVLWEDANGNTEALSRDALAQRLRRMRTAPASSARLRVSKLQRVK